MDSTNVRQREALIKAAADAYGEGSWQHRVRIAYLAGVCARCGGELDIDRQWRHCSRCRIGWAPQFHEGDLPKPTSLIVGFPD